MKRRLGLWMAAVAMACAAQGQQVPPQPEAWVVSFAWSPEYCKRNLGAKEPQCLTAHYFALSGLFPGHSRPAGDCRGEAFPKALLPRALDALPNEEQLQKVWRREGTCTGLGAEEYLLQLERAGRRLLIPEQFKNPGREGLTMSPAELKASFSADNPGMPAEALSLRCRSKWLEEIRVCLDRDFQFQPCADQVSRECPDTLRLRPLRPGLRVYRQD